MPKRKSFDIVFESAKKEVRFYCAKIEQSYTKIEQIIDTLRVDCSKILEYQEKDEERQRSQKEKAQRKEGNSSKLKLMNDNELQELADQKAKLKAMTIKTKQDLLKKTPEEIAKEEQERALRLEERRKAREALKPKPTLEEKEKQIENKVVQTELTKRLRTEKKMDLAEQRYQDWKKDAFKTGAWYKRKDSGNWDFNTGKTDKLMQKYHLTKEEDLEYLKRFRSEWRNKQTPIGGILK